MRRLIHIPIIHTAADLGSLSGPVQAHYAKICGPAGWSQREQVVQAFWDGVQTSLDALHLDCRKVRIYQDGLPICGFEERIIRELARAGSSNHQLILHLLDEGATIMGTEDPGLLMEEYEMQKRRLAQKANNDPAWQESKEQADRVLQQRDAQIAARIAATLQEGEVGLLFVGALHRVDEFKDTDIRVETLGERSRETIRWPRS